MTLYRDLLQRAWLARSTEGASTEGWAADNDKGEER